MTKYMTKIEKWLQTAPMGGGIHRRKVTEDELTEAFIASMTKVCPFYRVRRNG